MRLDGYIRVSRVGKRGGESFISPELQHEQIEAWAKLRGVTIAEWHTDLDQTGGKMSRPAFDTMLDRVRAGTTGGVAVARLDRFSRAGLADALTTVADIHQAGGSLAAVDLGVDPTTPFGEFAMTIMLALARMERRRIADNWRNAQTKAIERGVKITTHVPVGYDKGEDGRLVPNGDAPIVRELFRRRGGGDSWTVLADWLTGHVKPPKAERWTPRTVGHIVGSRVYLGEATFGELHNPAAHPAIIGVDEWRAAQLAAGVRPATVSRTGGALLSGLVRCAGCRYRMRAGATGRTAHARVLTYSCKRNHGGGRCGAPAAVTARIVDEYVEGRFRAEATRLSAIALRSSEGLDEARSAAAHAEAELVAYRDDLRARELLGAHWLPGLEARAKAVDDANVELVRVERVAGTAAVGELPWEAMTVDERRRVLTASIDAVFLRSTGQLTVPIRERVHICWRGEGPEDLPGPGRSRPVRPFEWARRERDAGVAGA